MQLDIRRQGVEVDDEVRQRLQRRLQFALGRFDSRLARVWVHLAHDNGTHGGPGTRCRILVRLQRMHDVLVEDRGDDLPSLIDRTVNRAGLAVRREVGRHHEHRNGT